MNIEDTLKDRAKEYGAFPDHAFISQVLKDSLRDMKGWGKLSLDQREALDMIMHKIARILNGNPNNHDSWHDIVGYAKLVADRLNVNKP